MAENVWDRVAAEGFVQDGTLVYWYLDYRFPGPDPWVFDVQWADTQAGPWETIVAGLSSHYYQDSERRRYGKYINSFYRIKLTDGNGVEYLSPAVSPQGIWNRHDYLLARDIVRKEYLLQRKYTGRQGLLYKRYIMGEACSKCLDHDTGEVTNSNCTSCFGTGLVGGYAPPIELWTTSEGEQRGATRDGSVDQADNIRFAGRIVGFPLLQVGDFWLDVQTGERFAIRGFKEIATVRGQAIVNMVDFKLLQSSHIIYSIPTDWAGAHSVSSSSSSEG